MSSRDSVMPSARLFHPPLVAAGATLLIAALATDVLYWRTFLTQWENFSIWLITGGLLLAALAGIALLLDLALRRAGRMHWLDFAMLTVAALLSVLNAFIHSRDGYTAVGRKGSHFRDRHRASARRPRLEPVRGAAAFRRIPVMTRNACLALLLALLGILALSACSETWPHLTRSTAAIRCSRSRRNMSCHRCGYRR